MSGARASRPAASGRARVARTLSADARADARTVSLAEAEAATVETIMAALPDPAELAAGTLVVVPGEIAAARSLTRSVLAVFGRVRSVSRALRCTALVARGYIDVGAGEADDTRADLAWGRVPPTTEPC